MATIRARFDGKVFIPEGPVDLAIGASVEIPLRDDMHRGEPPLMWLVRLAEAARRDKGDDTDYPRDYAAQIDQYLYGVPKDPKNDPPQ